MGADVMSDPRDTGKPVKAPAPIMRLYCPHCSPAFKPKRFYMVPLDQCDKSPGGLYSKKCPACGAELRMG
jgi:Zn-finger nucleic acid-binding protein